MHAVAKEVEIAAPPAAVWAALTQPNRVRRWLFDGSLGLQADWRVGGEMVFSGSFHGDPFEDRGLITALEPGKRYVYQYWSHFSPGGYHTTVEVTLVPTAAGTLLRVEHRDLPTTDDLGHANFYWGGAVARIKAEVEGAPAG